MLTNMTKARTNSGVRSFVVHTCYLLANNTEESWLLGQRPSLEEGGERGGRGDVAAYGFTTQ